jgi:hypothetical protein
MVLLRFRFILPAIEQIRSDSVTPARLQDIPAFDVFLHDLPFPFRGSIHAWLPTHVASCLEPLIYLNEVSSLSGGYYFHLFSSESLTSSSLFSFAKISESTEFSLDTPEAAKHHVLTQEARPRLAATNWLYGIWLE